MGRLRASVSRGALSARAVCWNGETLSDQFLLESKTAVENTFLGNGYLTSSCDPLLIAFAATFNVSVRHDYCGHTCNYEVATPECIVCLRSTKEPAHMSFAGVLPARAFAMSNIDIPGPRSGIGRSSKRIILQRLVELGRLTKLCDERS